MREGPLKRIFIAIAATILVASPNLAGAQEEPSGEELLLPEGQDAAPQPDKKKRQEKAQELLKKKRQERAEQRENKDQGADQADQQEQQPEKPMKKLQKKDQAEDQGSDQAPQPDQAEQSAPPEPVVEEPPQPSKKKKAEERKKRDAEPAQTEENQPQPAEKQAEPQQDIPAEAAEFLADKRGVGELSDAELKSRVTTGRALSRNEQLSRKQRQQAQEKSKQAAAELLRREKSGQAQVDQPAETEQQPKADQQDSAEGQPSKSDQPKSQAEREQAKELDGNRASPEAEAKAQEFLRDQNAADRLDDEGLRQRLESMRGLLAQNELSQDSERALRGQLQNEREVLRSRVAAKVEQEQKTKRKKEQQEAKNQGEQGKQGRERRGRRSFDNWEANDVLRDRRRSDELEEGELRRRIDVYRDAANDDRYDEGNRRYWRETMEHDRRTLRGRMIAGRRDRADDYRRRRDAGGVDININLDLGDDRPDSIFVDEVDDDELEEQLAAAPRRKISRRYSVEEIEDDPEIREAMPAIEIDTVRFGFNESFVREEEVDRLDRIAEIIEKILAAHPGEVFMIEGHTDAVGSDTYNLNLSRQRAQAVKQALTTFYVIPSRNLQTVGYGERYLKIPTAEPEQENRRVTLRRVTPLVGEALED